MSNKHYNLINSNINILLKSSEMNCLILLSPCGLGKSTMILQTMKDKGYTKDIHFLYRNSFFTPLAFFNVLKETNNLKSKKILILDDTESLLKNNDIINFLKSACWKANLMDKRSVFYNTTSKKGKNNKLDFEGKIIMLINEIPAKNSMLQAIIDRSLFVKFEYSNQQILQLMEKEIIPKNYGSSTYQQRQKVFKFIRQNCNKESDLSFRVLIKAFNFFLYSPQNWQEMTLPLLATKQPTNKSNLF